MLAKKIIQKNTVKHSDRINGSKVIKHLRTIVNRQLSQSLGVKGKYNVCIEGYKLN